MTYHGNSGSDKQHKQMIKIEDTNDYDLSLFKTQLWPSPYKKPGWNIQST